MSSIARKDARRIKKIRDELESFGLDHEKVIDCLYRNEDGDARLFQYLFDGIFIYDHGAALWNKWHGHYWQEDETDDAYKSIEKVVELYRNALTIEKKNEKKIAEKSKKNNDTNAMLELEAEEAKCQATQKQLNSRIMGLESASRKRNVLWLAGIGTGLTGREWDIDPMKLACKNGVLDNLTALPSVSSRSP